MCRSFKYEAGQQIILYVIDIFLYQPGYRYLLCDHDI